MMKRGGEKIRSKSAAARFRSLSKLWGSMLHRLYFTELFLTRSCARPRLLFALRQDGEREWSFFSSPQLQNPYKKSSLVESADFHVKFSNDMWPPVDFFFRGLTSGFIYFPRTQISAKKGWSLAGPVIFNPRTRQYVSLPKLGTDSDYFLGFDPIDKEFKVLSVAENNNRILTLGTGEMVWRKVQCGGGICINGVLYYLAETFRDTTEPYDDYAIVSFDVKSEKYKFIELKYFKAKLINYKGKLRKISWNYTDVGTGRRALELRMLVLEDVEEQKWSKCVYTLEDDKLVDCDHVSVVGVTAAGEIVLSMDYTSKYTPFYVFYFNPERSTLQSVEIQGF
ncbi:hypothetical protein EUTSA_v10009314mg, partial [Eutrema salsugineum]